jgi:hypothetical protein
MWGGWGIYSPNHQKWSLGGCLSHDAPDSPVPLPRHGAVGFWPLELKSSGPPDSPVVHRTGPIDCLVRLLARAWLLRALARIKCCCRWPLTWKKSLLCWHTGHCPVAHRTVRCARPGHTSADFCSLYLNPFSVFLLVCCEPLAPVRTHNLEQTSLVQLFVLGNSTTKIN